MNNKPVITKNRIWTTKEEHDKLQAFAAEWNAKFEKRMFWGEPWPELSAEQKYNNHIKLAYVEINDKRVMLGVHNENMKGYALEDRPTVKFPLEEVPYDRFQRWCRMMDV